jgi:hypothetical protein
VGYHPFHRYGESWEHARLRFVLADHDSSLAATGGTLVETLSAGGRIYAYVDCTLSALATTVVSVFPVAPNNTGVDRPATPAAWLDPPSPNPFRPGATSLAIHFALAHAGGVRLSVMDIAGRRVASVARDTREAGPQTVAWNGRDDRGAVLPSGVYLIVLETERGTSTRRVLLMD